MKSPPVRGTKHEARGTKHGLLAGLLVVALGCAAVWWLAGRAPDHSNIQTSKHSNIHKIAETTPAVVTNRTVAKAEAKPKERPPQRVGELRDGYRLLPNGRLHKVVGITTSRVTRVTLAEKTFKHETDAEIYDLVNTEPGTGFIGESKDYFQHFDKHFLESLKDEIVIEKDDSDEVKAMKEDVIALRKDLKERYDAGEDINQVMRDTREQLRELGLYKQELENEMDRAMRESKNMTEADVETLVEAANKMLEERGVKPFKMTSTLKRRFREYSRKKNANKNEKEIAK